MELMFLSAFVLANWRWFSGGQRDMYKEVLKFGSYQSTSTSIQAKFEIEKIPKIKCKNVRPNIILYNDTDFNPKRVKEQEFKFEYLLRKFKKK